MPKRRGRRRKPDLAETIADITENMSNIVRDVKEIYYSAKGAQPPTERPQMSGDAPEEHAKPQVQKKAMTLDQARDILEVNEQSSEAEIKRAYKDKVRMFHPDNFGDTKTGHAAMVDINLAYDVLMKDLIKKRYG